MNEKDYSGPVRLAPIQWGAHDKATAFALLRNMQDCTPPIVIPWTWKDSKVRALLTTANVRFFNW